MTKLSQLATLPQTAHFENERPRVLLYSHDTFGLGHLRRNLAIATHLLQRSEPFAARLLTGSPVADSWPMPSGLEIQSLPPVVKTGAEEYSARDGRYCFAEIKARRERIILESVIRYRPHIFLVDHAPAGMKGELLKALAIIRVNMPGTRTILGLRDIIDSSPVVRKLWREQAIYQLLNVAYDNVLVYGSRNLFDPVYEYDLPPAVAAKTGFCGYITRDYGGPHAVDLSHSEIGTVSASRPLILVTAGGGGDGFPVLSAYLRALERVPPDTAQSIVVAGPLMAAEDRKALEQMAAKRSDVRMMFYTTELTELIKRADLVVAMAGYNTTAEILAAKKSAILVPRGAPRMEQRLRAKMLSDLGLAWAIQPEEDLVARLEELIKAALSGARPSGHGNNAIDLGGVHQVGSALAKIVSTTQKDIGVWI